LLQLFHGILQQKMHHILDQYLYIMSIFYSCPLFSTVVLAFSLASSLSALPQKWLLFEKLSLLSFALGGRSRLSICNHHGMQQLRPVDHS
jgi:hypothetical protein